MELEKTGIVTFDTETTIFEKGNPFSRRNKLCYVGVDCDGVYADFDIEYSNSPYGHYLPTIKETLESAELVVGFNLKFDLHWIKRYVPNLVIPSRVWDCQLAEFILSNQQWVYPSLNESLIRRGLEPKLDVVSTEYWAHGLDTPTVPEDILTDYLRTDVTQTKALYLAQVEEFAKRDPKLLTLFRIQCVDLLVLQEMEFNGMYFDVEKSEELAEETQKHLVEIDERLNGMVGIAGINWNSSDHVSAVLYGGIIKTKVREKTQRILKDGTIKEGERWGVHEEPCIRRVAPIKGTETVTEGIFSVGEPILKSLRARGSTKRIIESLLERSRLQKLFSTYYQGIPEIIVKKDWERNLIHGQFNQVVAATGRLSSSNPNLQNFAGDIKGLFYSRYYDE